jgi:hypothetical protein
MVDDFSLWDAFEIDSDARQTTILVLLNPVVVLLGARLWRWPQYVLKILSILPFAGVLPAATRSLQYISSTVSKGETAYTLYGILGEISVARLLIYAGFASVTLSLLASCVRPRPNPDQA